jgi:multidrug efflux pump subunit AcrA (membrane-fusion protein)
MIAPGRLSHRFTALESVKVPRVMRAVFYMLLVAFLSALVFLIYAPWVQTATGRGAVNTLNPNERKQDINALVPGRIEEWYVRDGSAVKKGDPIVRIADIDPQLVERLQAERAQVELQLQAAQSALATARLDEARARELFQAGLAARRDYEQAQIRIAERQGQVAAAMAALNRADVGLARQSEQIVRAPRDGFIQSLNAGDAATYVSAGDVLATFVRKAPSAWLKSSSTGAMWRWSSAATRRGSSSKAGRRCSFRAGPRSRSAPLAAPWSRLTSRRRSTGGSAC